MNTNSSDKIKNVSAVLLSAGKGIRMNQKIPKQLILINNMSIFERSLLALIDCNIINEIIVVVSPESYDESNIIVKKHIHKKNIKIVLGGQTRFESSQIGFNNISKNSEYVLFHDAARCLIKPNDITDIIINAFDFQAASAVNKITSTIKHVDDGFIEYTIDRNKTYESTTPQCFNVELYKQGLNNLTNLYDITDDNILIEKLNTKIKAVDIGNYNIKITTPLDLIIAKSIIEERNLQQ